MNAPAATLQEVQTCAPRPANTGDVGTKRHASGQSGQIPALTSIRFFLALLVVTGHFAEHFQPLDQSSPQVAVPAFFCLAGFVLTLGYDNFADMRAVGRFCIGRLARIVPIYLIVTTLSKRYGLWLSLSLLVAICLPTLTRDASLSHYLQSICPATRLFEFIVGVTAATIFRRWPFMSPGLGKLSFVQLTLLELATALGFLLWGHQSYQVCASLFAVFITLVAVQGGVISHVLKHPLLVKLGEASYALFLVHTVLLNTWFYNALPICNFGQPIGSLIVCTFSVAVAYVMYICIEAPWRTQILNIGYRLLSKWRPHESDRARQVEPLSGRTFLKLACQSVACFVVIALACGCGCRWVADSMYHLSNHGEESHALPLIGSENVLFGNSVRLNKACIWKSGDGVEVATYWSSAQYPNQATTLGAHLVDKTGTIITYADHKLYRGHDGVDRFYIPRQKLANITTLALSVYNNQLAALEVESGQRDWKNHRLLLPWPGNVCTAP
jgi:peptidoglycan/LPS O-acetylase OafA/YrhL